MAMSQGLMPVSNRLDPRDEVHHRTRATGPDGRSVTLLLVNISARGLMARCDTPYQPGEWLSVQMPVVGTVRAEIRWALGGRIGCQLDDVIPLADYYAVLAAMVRA